MTSSLLFVQNDMDQRNQRFRNVTPSANLAHVKLQHRFHDMEVRIK